MNRQGFSPLERRLLLALVSHIRDSQRPPYSPHEPPEEWAQVMVNLRALYECCYVLDPGKSWELQRRNQRQAMRRALGRLSPEYVWALALGWCEVDTCEWVDWQGGGSHERKPGDPYPHGYATPRWRRVTLTKVGIKAALLLEQEPSS